MQLGGKRSGVVSSFVPIFLIFFSEEFKALALQMPYGGISKSLLQAPENGPHPFLARFIDRSSLSNTDHVPAQKSKLLNRLRRKNLQIDNNPPKSRAHAQRKSLLPSELGTRDGILHNNVLNDGKDEVDNIMAMQDLDRMLEEELNYAQQLASGIIVDMKSMLADIRKGEAEFADGVNPELKKTIENAIDIPDQERLLRLS